jgi:hypothetical protein
MTIARVSNDKRDSCTEEIWGCGEGESNRLRADMEAIHNGGKEVVESVGSMVRAKKEYLVDAL